MILVRLNISLRRALALMILAPSMYYYRRKRDDQPALELMRAYADENPAHGQDMMAHGSQIVLQAPRLESQEDRAALCQAQASQAS